MQLGVAPVHMSPQPLQFRGSLDRSAHPSAPQSVNPTGQAQVPEKHDLPPSQGRSHMPQCEKFEPVLTQAPPHSVGALAGQTHIAPVHDAVGGQTLPHIPQFEVVLSATQIPPQREVPDGHTQVPLQIMPVPQTLPQAPQFEVVLSIVSQPSRSGAVAEQLSYPETQPP